MAKTFNGQNPASVPSNALDLRARYGKSAANLAPTASDLTAEIGKKNIRVHGVGVRGLRFLVKSVDAAKEMVTLTDAEGTDFVQAFCEVCIAPIAKK